LIFFGQKMVFAVVFGAFSVRAFGARCGSQGFSFLTQENLLALLPWVGHHEYDAFYYSAVREQSHGFGVCPGPAVYVGCVSTGNDYA
jgi:hypothetical protein